MFMKTCTRLQAEALVVTACVLAFSRSGIPAFWCSGVLAFSRSNVLSFHA
jgi:hypothetical protein